MGDSDDLPGSDSEMVVSRGETYNHAKHGQVEVTGIWKGVENIDKARHTDEKDVVIIRYSAEINGEEVDELTDPLDEFLQSIK
ncbi:hypothetical protein [Halopiger xanaduensis]|uniref:Uncharacterized protein n=1 Tax=Halopiger xanaduensis (strain DSM 18323 / JCM 14033 / SH-6) TaxID=797210 RepID=F8DC45_HALXS|nr:hypothetical protein [Halopiger xanaduensis]AEH37158.1 hypothetical protein Halxa_2540 [Halopiger xanaduensis SH-6]